MNFSVTEGAIYTAQKVVIYGPEGIGKTTLARQFPDPVFIDTEESSKGYAVQRITLPDGGVRPGSWTVLLEMVKAVRDGAITAKTLVIDSLDWAETLCAKHVCDKHQKTGIEDWGFGKGYVYLEEEFGALLNLLSEVTGKGIHVVCTAHAGLQRKNEPEETGSYDYWSLKLEKKTAALVKEWADIVLFCNYKIMVIAGKNPMEKNKAAGGKRMMYASHTPWWDAKNRHQLPDDMPMEYSSIAHLFTVQRSASAAPVSAPVPKSETKPPKQIRKTEAAQPPADTMDDLPFYDSSDVGGEAPPEFLEPEKPSETGQSTPPGIIDELWELMRADGVTEAQVQEAVAKKGYYPPGTPIGNYEPQFIRGCLIAAWPQVKATIT